MKDRCLFKAKICNGEWVAGFLHCKNDKWYISNKAGAPFAFEVRPDTICQCTGLKDKNGKLIWENDVIKVCWQDNETQCEEITQVAWDEFGYYPWLDEYHCDGCDLFNEVRDIEVIGNIFDNPELIKESDT